MKNSNKRYSGKSFLIIPANEELNKSALKYSIILAWLFVIIYPIWGLLDFFYAREWFFQFMVIRLAHSFFLIIVIFLTKKFTWKPLIINYAIFLGVSVEIAYMCNVVALSSLFIYFTGYSCLFIICGLFFIWKPIHPFIIFISSILFYFGFNFFIHTHQINQVIGYGGLFFFSVAIGFSFFSMIRYSQTKSEIKARLIISEANKKLLELDKAKTNFFTNVSHELRTPLTLIITPLKILHKKAKVHKKISISYEDIDSIQRNSYKLLKIINTLLDFSKIEEGKMHPRFRRINLNKYIKLYTSAIEHGIKLRNITLRTEINDNLFIYADTEMFEKIIMNLLSNAYKFTNSGGEIKVTAREKKDIILIEVSDTGIGIPAHKIKTVFNRFTQADGGIHREYGGTGIGLSLVKELMDIHKGNITVTSHLGKRTAFTLSFRKGHGHLENKYIYVNKKPDCCVDKMDLQVKEYNLVDFFHQHQDINPTQQKSNACTWNDYKILIVEDNPDMISFLLSLLQNKYNVFSALNGREGLEKCIKILPDLIISDIMMPQVDGYTFIEQLRNHEKLNSVPVILLTAKTGIADKIQGFEKGACDYIIKPFQPEDLLLRIQSHIKLKQLREDLLKVAGLYEGKSKRLTDMTKAKIKKIKEYIVKNYRDPITRERLATIADISPDHLSRMFYRDTGYKINEFCNNLRITEAAKKLLTTNSKIIDIAFDVGFENMTTFNRTFHKVMKSTPSAYRKKLQKK